MFQPVDSDSQAVFAQVDVQAHDKVKLVFAGRWDDSSLHDSQVSPKASVVYSVAVRTTRCVSRTTKHSRLPTTPSFFSTPRRHLTADLSAFEGICQGNGVMDCALGWRNSGSRTGQRRPRARRDHDVGGRLQPASSANKAFLTIDYYSSENENFITDLLPNVGTSLGRINPDFGPWVGSDAAETTTNVLPEDNHRHSARFVRGRNDSDALQRFCRPAEDYCRTTWTVRTSLPPASYTNFGEVDTQGADLALNYRHDGPISSCSRSRIHGSISSLQGILGGVRGSAAAELTGEQAGPGVLLTAAGVGPET